MMAPLTPRSKVPRKRITTRDQSTNIFAMLTLRINYRNLYVFLEEDTDEVKPYF